MKFPIRLFQVAIVACLFSSCIFDNTKEAEVDTPEELWPSTYNDSAEVAANADHPFGRMRYKLIQSKVQDRDAIFKGFYQEVMAFSDARYEELRPLILEQSIPAIQASVKSGAFTYEELVLFYLKRIYRYELNPETTLYTIMALNPKVLEEARALKANADGEHPVYGLPILLKDNIGTQEMKTTAGAIALMENQTEDAFIVEQLKKKGALILGKVNLSEWAYFMCTGCPVGYSAVGGQTLNPYGRKIFESGGSSSGSGTSMAANYAVAAVGTETSGSILSPSSQNSVVGMKPTIGLLSRTGIVPISSTLDTPGPMTRSVIDNAIVMDAMRGFDIGDDDSVKADWPAGWYRTTEADAVKGKRFGVFNQLVERDSVYKATVEKLERAGAKIVLMDSPEIGLPGFITLLNIDMKVDLVSYLSTMPKDTEAVKVRSVADVVEFNLQDTLTRVPYGMQLLEGIVADTTSQESLEAIKKQLQTNGRLYFNQLMNENQLDAVLSLNNAHAGFAAVAKYPALTIPMGYTAEGEPRSLTLIGKQFQEGKLYRLGAPIESLLQARKTPEGYTD